RSYGDWSSDVCSSDLGRFSNCSMLEAIAMCENISGEQLDWTYVAEPRKGDHQWWISDCSRFQSHYPNWRHTYDVRRILTEIYERSEERRVGKECGSRR